MIDLSRYRSHLSGFEAQLNDIGVFREPGMARKAAGISTLSDDIRKRDLRINDLCRQLRGAYLETERILPELSRKIHEQEAVKSDFYKQRDSWTLNRRTGQPRWKRVGRAEKRLVGGGSETGFLCRKRYPDGDGSL